MSASVSTPLSYTPPELGQARAKYLVVHHGVPDEQRLIFYDGLEIGRDDGSRQRAPGLLLIADSTVSWRHCIVTQVPDGRCFVRDTSRNGTRLDGRRLIPNVEHEIRIGQTLVVGAGHELILAGNDVPAPDLDAGFPGETVGMPGRTIATVLVGDIRDYTVLVRRAPTVELQQSISRTFDLLGAHVVRHGGTLKEYQGDALLAFWEGSLGGEQAVAACRAALALDGLTRQLAIDQTVWQVGDFPLTMDWALATGPVLIDTFGGARPAGLSLIGEPVVFAFRIEKFATEDTGRILTCQATRDLAHGQFKFRDLGLMTAKGFDRPDRVFALDGGPPERDAQEKSR